MRFAISIFVFCMSAYVLGAEMSGDLNAWLGHLAGMNADGDRTTLMGAGAGGQGGGLSAASFVGAASGAYATNVHHSVALGYHSLRKASGINNVVAIGSGAFSNRTDLVNATWINGQFSAYATTDSFSIKADPSILDEEAPIHYSNGILNFNVDSVKIRGGAQSDGDGVFSLSGYDLYVDPNEGDDSLNGASVGSPKRTIDGAYLCVTNHGMTICLLPGVHTSPRYLSWRSGGENLPPYGVRIVAPYGPEKTSIVGDNARQFIGHEDFSTSVSGCEFRDFVGHSFRLPPFYNVVFSNCVFKGEISSLDRSDSCGLFLGCTLDHCRIEAACKPMGVADLTDIYEAAYAATFAGCAIMDSVIAPEWKNGASLFSCGSTFYNSYVEMGTAECVDGVLVNYVGDVSRFVDTTLISTNVTSFGFNGAVSTWHACLIGFNAPDNIPVLTNNELSVITNALAVKESIGADLRPGDMEWRFRFAGYESYNDRATRDTLYNSVKSLLAENMDLSLSSTSRSALKRSVEQNMAHHSLRGERPQSKRSKLKEGALDGTDE